VTTVAGLFPLLLERSFQAQFLIPMAVSICFGLIAATALTLLYVPALFLIIQDITNIVKSSSQTIQKNRPVVKTGEHGAANSGKALGERERERNVRN
jgi:hypothetical protein